MRNTLIVAAVGLAIVLAVREWIDGILILSQAVQPKQTLLRREASLAPVTVPGPRVFDAVVETTEKIDGSTPLEVADNYVRLHKDEWGVQAHHELRPTLFQTPLGSRVKYVVYQDDLPVLGLEIVLQINLTLQVTKVDNKYRPLQKADVRGRVMAPEEVLDLSSERFTPETGSVSSAATVIYAEPTGDKPELAYVMPMKEKTPDARPVQILFRASDGQVLGRSYSRTEF